MKQKLHPKAVWLFFLGESRVLVGLLPLIIIIVYLRISSIILKEIGSVDSSGAVITWGWGSFIVISFVIGLPLKYIWARLFYNSYFFELTEDAIKIEKGVIWKKYVSIPYERIQNVDIYRGLFARLLGLSDLQVQTAGASGYSRYGFAEGRLPG